MIYNFIVGYFFIVLVIFLLWIINWI